MMGKGHALDGAILDAGSIGDATPPDPRPGEVWFLMGLAGAGKSTLAQAVPRARVVSIDDIRHDLGLSYGRRSWVSDAYARAYDEVEATLAQGHLCVFDSSGLYASAREEVLALAGFFRAPARLIYIATPPQVARAREERQHPARTTLPTLPRLLLRTLHALQGQEALDPIRPLLGWTSVHTLDMESQARAIAAWSGAPAG